METNKTEIYSGCTMAKLSYNDFRKLHKGIPSGQTSELWKKYKEGTYEPDSDADGVHDGDELVETSNESPKQEAVESSKDETPKPTAEEALALNLQKFVQCYRLLQRKNLLEADRLKYSALLTKLASVTRPLNYSCKPEDGWQLWVGPTEAALLVNERNQIAFCITRSWWAKNYQGSFLVQDMVVDEPNRIIAIRENHRKRNKLVLRNPIPGVEIMLPLSKLEAIVTSSGSYEG